MVETIHENVAHDDGPRDPPHMEHESYNDDNVGGSFTASHTFGTSRKSLFDSNSDKLPINLCAKPNR